MRILVTGADGFIGSHLIPVLIENNHKLCLIGGDKKRLLNLCNNNSLCFSFAGLGQKTLIKKITEFSPEIVINLAGYSTSGDGYDDMERLFSVNIFFLGKILDTLKNINLKCFIYIGSSTEYFREDGILNPAYLYSATKTAGRSILSYYSDVYEFKSIFITPYNVYGEGSNGKIIDILSDSLDSEVPVNTTYGEQILDFIHVSDLTRLFIMIIENLGIIPDRTNFNAGTGEGTSVRKLAELLEIATKKQTNINWGGIPYRKKDTMHSIADISKQKVLFGWEPLIGIDEGIIRYLESKERNNILNK